MHIANTAMRIVGLFIATSVASSCLYPEIPAAFDGRVEDDAASSVDGDNDAETIPTFNGCRAESFVDRSEASAERTVSFGGTNGSDVFSYSPRCIAIAAGQSVDFRGGFATHPLSPGIGPSARDAGSPNSPIPTTGGGISLTVRFDAPGTYPYFCEMHVATGMAGVVHVR